MCPHPGILRTILVGVVVQYLVRCVACQLHELSVARQVGDMQVESHAALLRSFQVAGTAELQVRLGNFEAVVRLTHDVDAAFGVLREFVLRHENAVALVCTATYPAPQLVQLCQSESFGILNHHHRGIRHIHAHLNDCRGHEDIYLSTHETLHHGIFLRRFHLAVHLGNLQVWEDFAELRVAVLEVLHIYLLALFDEWIDHIHLPSLLDFRTDTSVQRLWLLCPEVSCLYGLAAGRQLVDNADVEVAVERHR